MEMLQSRRMVDYRGAISIRNGTGFASNLAKIGIGAGGGALCVQMDFTWTFEANTKCYNINYV